MAKVIRRPQDCMDYKVVESFAKSKKVEIEKGKGDHSKLIYNKSMFVYPRREMGLGIACKVFKWFIEMGLLGLLLYIVLYQLHLI